MRQGRSVTAGDGNTSGKNTPERCLARLDYCE